MKINAASRRLVTIDSLNKTPLGMDLMNLKIPLSNQAGGFIECLRKKVPVVINGQNNLEKKVLKYLQTREIGLIPLVSNRKAIGLLSIDNTLSGLPLKPSALSSAAILIDELGTALQNLPEAGAVTDIQESAIGTLPVDKTEATLTEAFNAAKSGDGKLSLVLIEFDQFKEFINRHGQDAYDNVLQLVGGTLQKMSRPSDIVGRWSEDRFLIILPNTTSSEVVPFGERISKELGNVGQLLTKRFPGQALTACVGLTAYDPTMSQSGEMYDQVAKALKLAQSEGPSSVRLYVTIY
jgi:diguanylate cyclase (GGDEF)-like protein